MAKKKKNDVPKGVMWIAGSNISDATRKMGCEFAEKGGTTYFIEGKPGGGGGCIPGTPGCQ